MKITNIKANIKANIEKLEVGDIISSSVFLRIKEKKNRIKYFKRFRKYKKV